MIIVREMLDLKFRSVFSALTELTFFLIGSYELSGYTLTQLLEGEGIYKTNYEHHMIIIREMIVLISKSLFCAQTELTFIPV
jgi:hypothetical protein